MALRRKMYYALIVALAVGGVVFHKTAMAIIENFPALFGVNSYVFALGLVYLVLTISVVEYFVLYRLRHVDERLEEAKNEGFDHFRKVFDAGQDDEIGRISSTINDVLSKCETKGAELRRSNEMYSSIVNDAPLLVCRFTPDGTITFVNDAFAKKYSKDKKELIGANLFKLVESVGGEAKNIKRSLTKIRPGRESDTTFYDTPVVTEPFPKWMMWVNRGFFDRHGKTIEFQSVGVDVYRQTTNGLNSMMNDILSLVYFVNKDGRLKYASPTNEGILGFQPSDMVGKNIFDFIHDENRAFLQDQFDRRFGNKEKQTSIQELRIKNHKDQYTWVQAAIDSIVASNGSVSNVAINARDITDLKEANNNLAAAFTNMQKILDRVNTLEFIIEKSPVITFVWKKGSSLDYISGNVALLGYEKEDFMNEKLSFEDIIHPDDRDRVISHISTSIDEYTELGAIKYRLLKKDGVEQFVIDRTIAVKNDDSSVAYYRGVELINE
jgi:PAS domain S-box-containing protein